MSYLLLSLLMLSSSLSSATPFWPATLARPAIGKVYQSLQQSQQLLLKSPEPLRIPPPETIPEPRKQTFQFDARENSVGVVFTTADGAAVHLWLPLGRKLYTRKLPVLPVHPFTARISTMIHTSPALAAPEVLDRIQCDVWTYGNRTGGRGKGRPEKWKVSFSKTDELVRFADDAVAGRFWLGGKEVESYECS